MPLADDAAEDQAERQEGHLDPLPPDMTRGMSPCETDRRNVNNVVQPLLTGQSPALSPSPSVS